MPEQPGSLTGIIKLLSNRPVLGERVHAFIVPREGRLIETDSIRSCCARGVSDYKVPEALTVLDAPAPRNGNGKVQKQVLKALLGEWNPNALAVVTERNGWATS
jgi:long-chain acyl-CoA synthetase